jgi:hypothetical protein
MPSFASTQVNERFVTATLSELTGPRRGLMAIVRDALPRDEFFAGLYIVGCANGLGGNILRALSSGDWTGGIGDISAIVWFACFAGISLLLRGKKEEVTSADLAIGLVFLALTAVPVNEVNWAAVTGLSLYILLFAQGEPARRRGALILLTLTGPMLWTRLLFAFFAKPILIFDATFVAWLLGTHWTGNIVGFADGSGDLVILPACSSLANVSLAFLCWVSVTQWLGHQWSRQDILWCGLACVSVVAVNTVRIAIMGLSHWHYETFHYGWGATVANAITLGLIIGITALGVRRELFSSA